MVPISLLRINGVGPAHATLRLAPSLQARSAIQSVEPLHLFRRELVRKAPNDFRMRQPFQDAFETVFELPIQCALEHANGNRTETARLLNISTKALLQKLRRYGLIEI